MDKMSKEAFNEMVLDIVKRHKNGQKLSQYELGVLVKISYGAKYEDFEEVE